MALNCNTKHPLQHDGTSQQQRFAEALEPSYAPVHEFSLRDWMRFAWHFAEKLRFFSHSDHQKPNGNWQEFMKSEEEIEAFLKDAALAEGENWLDEEEQKNILKREPKGNYEPHLALFLSFLKLTKFSQQHLNTLTGKHLEFYYGEVLKISKRKALPDRVHVIFELAKNANSGLIKKDTLLDGGKDDNGKPILYRIEEELTVNKARVAHLKSIFHQPGKAIRYAEMTNSADGLGTEFESPHPRWRPFGNPNWPAATTGFAVASQVLMMKEGERKITMTIQLKNPVKTQGFPSPAALESAAMALITGEEDWIQIPEIKVHEYSGNTLNQLVFELDLSQGEDAIVPYDAEIHNESFNTRHPVLRLLFNAGTEEGYGLFDALKKLVINKIDITISVKGKKDVIAENDQGKLDTAKPFLPFGSVPRAGSNFYIGSSEIFQKNWKTLDLQLSWKNKPFSITSHYQVYHDAGHTINGEDHFGVKASYLKNGKWFPDSSTAEEKSLFSSSGISITPESSIKPKWAGLSKLLIQKGLNPNIALIKNYLAPKPVPKKKQSNTAQFPLVVVKPIVVNLAPIIVKPIIMATAFHAAAKSDFLRLTLTKSFLHEHYARLYSLAMIEIANGGEADIPNEPYTPEVSDIQLNYTAEASNRFHFESHFSPEEKLQNYQTREVQLFHELPFGQTEQHVFLREQATFADALHKKEIRLMPDYAPEGEFFIGLENASGSDIVSLLFHAAEGSENPLAPTFADDKPIEWFALVNNDWQSLNKNFLLANTTNNFLRSGIVRLQLPAAAHSENTALEKGFQWIKAVLPKGTHHTSVCELTGIFAQAAKAVFSGNDQESPLEAETLAKIIDKPGEIKGVAQPYPSFGGTPGENDRDYWLRTSERLRHKNRAVTLFDYERLVLQQFPEVYKVKCLTHTSLKKPDGSPDYFEINPGHVSLLVIPDISNQKSYDPLQPRASRNLLSKVEDFINPLNTLHVQVVADNPDYEVVLLDFNVKFHPQYDPNTYKKILNNDIVKYLSPWAFGEYGNIHFGGTLHKSILIGFIEDRPYVDFVSAFKLMREAEMTDTNYIQATSARAILVSARYHSIKPIENDQTCDQ
ncbi:MAG: hypothetical protein EA361_12780 [Bacteroidetes bacterium]|nr:MAG: hypothetical protein EA361_12780 [Bacteroidota bacterium]